MYFRFFCICVFVCCRIWRHKNNNLVRLSSIVPFHIIYQVNLYWRNNSAHKYNWHFFTLWLSILTFPAFSTLANWSRIFMSRIFSRPHRRIHCALIVIMLAYKNNSTAREVRSSNRATFGRFAGSVDPGARHFTKDVSSFRTRRDTTACSRRQRRCNAIINMHPQGARP